MNFLVSASPPFSIRDLSSVIKEDFGAVLLIKEFRVAMEHNFQIILDKAKGGIYTAKISRDGKDYAMDLSNLK